MEAEIVLKEKCLTFLISRQELKTQQFVLSVIKCSKEKKMRKVYCDKCGKEVPPESSRVVYEIKEVKLALDLCRKHKKEFMKKMEKLFIDYKSKIKIEENKDV